MHRRWAGLALVLGLALPPAVAWGVDPGSPGCQAVNAYADGSVAISASIVSGEPYFYPGEQINVTANFSGIGDGAGWLSGWLTDGFQYPTWGGDTTELPVVGLETVIDAFDYGFSLNALDGDNPAINRSAAWSMVCYPATDGDGDGFPDLLDNFPEVYSKCRERQATHVGDSLPNVINGTSGNDVIMGFGGADTINGLEGDDLVCAGGGSDTVSGGDGKDKLYGEDGADTMFGNEQSDYLYGGNGADVLKGNGGTRDRLFGGDGIDDLNGGAGDDDRCTTGETYDNACEVIF